MIAHGSREPRSPERVVLLGARGFIARALRERLEAERINALALSSTELDLTRAESVAQLAARIERNDAVVMLAALTPDKGRDAGTLIQNLTMMRHVCAALEKARCEQLVYFSSDAVYDSGVSRVTEETPAAPRDLYGAMHRTREIMAASVPGVRLLVLRPTLVYGTHDTHDAYGPNRFRRAAAKDGKIALFGDGEEMRDHIHVDDVVRITHMCLEQQSTGVLNLATGRSISFRKVAELVALHFGERAEIVSLPRANVITHRHYDVTSLIKAFPGYRPIPIEEGIARCHREMVQAA